MNLLIKENLYWTTIEGKRIPIRQLDDRHLVNIIQMLNKRFPDIKRRMIGRCILNKFLKRPVVDFRGEYTSAEKLEKINDPGKLMPVYEALVKEAIRREIYTDLRKSKK